MTFRIFADRDGAGWRTRQRRRDQDLEFLARLRELVAAADEPRLGRLAMSLVCGPMWKRVAVGRALEKVSAALATTRLEGRSA